MFYQGSSYASQTVQPSSTTSPDVDTTNWAPLAVGLRSRGIFSSDSTYLVGDFVAFGTPASTYVAIQNVGPNAPNPGTDATKWTLLAAHGAAGTNGTAPVFTSITATAGAYNSSASVAVGGTPSAVTLAFTIPQGTPGATGAAGTPGAPGPASFHNRGPWQIGTYALGDLVTLDGSSYVANNAVPSTTTTAPDSDTADWTLIAQGGTNGSDTGLSIIGHLIYPGGPTTFFLPVNSSGNSAGATFAQTAIIMPAACTIDTIWLYQAPSSGGTVTVTLYRQGSGLGNAAASVPSATVSALDSLENSATGLNVPVNAGDLIAFKLTDDSGNGVGTLGVTLTTGIHCSPTVSLPGVVSKK